MKAEDYGGWVKMANAAKAAAEQHDRQKRQQYAGFSQEHIEALKRLIAADAPAPKAVPVVKRESDEPLIAKNTAAYLADWFAK